MEKIWIKKELYFEKIWISKVLSDFSYFYLIFLIELFKFF